jgi:hypothetical protein
VPAEHQNQPEGNTQIKAYGGHIWLKLGRRRRGIDRALLLQEQLHVPRSVDHIRHLGDAGLALVVGDGEGGHHGTVALQDILAALNALGIQVLELLRRLAR